MQSVLGLHCIDISCILSEKGRGIRYCSNRKYKIEPERYQIPDFAKAEQRLKTKTSKIILGIY